MANNYSKISNLVESQVPFFVRNDHGTFVDFVEAYYRFLEQEDETINRIKNISQAYDIDRSEEPYLEKIYNEYLRLVPKDALAEKALLIKHIKDFYRARGTEKSIRFLIQILFNKSSDFYYPKQDILRASDGKWFIQRSIRVGNFYVDNVLNTATTTLDHFISKTITGETSETTATVEAVDIYYRQGSLIQEISLSNIDGDFESGEQVFTSFEENDTTFYLSANIRSGEIIDTSIIDGGSGYATGEVITVTGDGSGASLKVGSVTSGNLLAIFVTNGGAGFKNNDDILVSSDTGSGATANVEGINPSEFYHPNTYNIISSLISLVANTQMNNEPYVTLNNSNANVHIQNACSRFNYGPCGPAQTIRVITAGNDYASVPTFDIQANTMIRSLGILGRMNIVSGGANYQVGDWIQFSNTGGAHGANASVLAVNGTGAITNVMFHAVAGHHIGGSGFSQTTLPELFVISAAGVGANVIAQAILGDGEILSGGTATIGEIVTVDIIDGGAAYTTTPLLDLTDIGDGNANVTATIITGVRIHPGRYLNDDGHLSGYNFLQDRHYYQNFSYVVRTEESIGRYKNAALNLTHPAGMKMFAQHLHEQHEVESNAAFEMSNHAIMHIARYSSVQFGPANSNVTINYVGHGVVATDNVYLEFFQGDTINISNGLFLVVTGNANTFYVTHPNVSNTSGNTHFGRIVYM